MLATRFNQSELNILPILAAKYGSQLREERLRLFALLDWDGGARHLALRPLFQNFLVGVSLLYGFAGIPRTEIESEVSVMQSLMWEGLLTGLAEEGVDSLLDYLETLQHRVGRVAGAVDLYGWVETP